MSTNCPKSTLSFLWRPFRLLFTSVANFSMSMFALVSTLVAILILLTITSANNLRVYVEPDAVNVLSFASSALKFAEPENEVQQSLATQLGLNGSLLQSSSIVDQSQRTAAILKRVRVLCFVITCEKNLETKAKAVKETWAKRCDKTIFISERMNSWFPAVSLPGVLPGHEKLWSKTYAAFLHAYEQYIDSFDWFLKTDDDTYVIMENLKAFLAAHNPSKPYYFGKRFRPYGEYMSGGAGYVLSRESVIRVGEAFKKTNSKICAQPSSGGAEDVLMGQCLRKVGVLCGNTLDSEASERFHPFHLGSELSDVLPGWYTTYSYYPIKKDFNCCSNYSITFHYVSPKEMKLIEFVVYHLRAFGLQGESALQLNEAYIRNLGPSNETELTRPKTNATFNTYANQLPSVQPSGKNASR